MSSSVQDKGELITTGYSAQCGGCLNYTMFFTCKAFPERIPEEIVTGLFLHTEPYPNAKNPTDHGIRFEPATDTLIDGELF